MLTVTSLFDVLRWGKEFVSEGMRAFGILATMLGSSARFTKFRFDDEGAKAFASAVEMLGNHHNGAEHSLAPVVSTEF